MFSPMGKKKILLEQRFIGGKSGKAENAPAVESGNESPDFAQSKSRKSRSSKDHNVTDTVASTTSLEKALADPGLTGVMMNKILESTIRYRPERDAVLLKAFQSKHIDYDRFRSYLYSAFWLGFDDNEYHSLLDYFDPLKGGVLNGYDFMIAFTRLNAIRKARESLAVREKQELFEIHQKEEEERKQLELVKKMDMAADYSFSEETRKRALRKLHEAAFKFDPTMPACGSTEAFNVNYMRPAVFKEMLKLTFNLKVDRAELGAILKEFNPNLEDSLIPASEFLRYFLRLGLDARDKARAEQRQKQLELTQQAEQESLKKLNEATQKLNLEVDYNFSEAAEECAKEKLLAASMKYDRHATGAVSLDGFECESLEPAAFKDLVRRVFNLNLSSPELGYVIQKYDTRNAGRLTCKPFLTDFLRMGQEARYKAHMEQLERQRALAQQAEEEHRKKIVAVQNSESIQISDRFADKHLQSALAKITAASVHYDKVRGVSLVSFEPATLTPLEFKKALKRTFNIKFAPQEMAAAVDYFDKDGSKQVHCQTFLSTFTILGANKRAEIRKQQLAAQREDWARQAEEQQKKVLSLSSKVQYSVDFDVSEVDKETAFEKMTEAAAKYDASHPAALGLEGFERKSMTVGEFKELVRRTFNLKLSPAEVGAVFEYFNAQDQEIDCKEFLRHFLHLGIAERNKVKKEQLDRQRKEDRDREEEHRRKLEEAANRQTFTVDMDFTDADKDSILQKLAAASEGFDKTHPAAPSLEAFEVAYLSPGIFRENLKRVFNVLASPKEIGYLMSVYDKQKTGKVDSKEFMIKFLAMGKKIRDDKRKAFLEEQRLAEKAAREEEERKLNALWEKADLQVDYDATGADLKSAVDKMTAASMKYDKTHPSAPSLDGFSGGPIKPGVFRELVRRAFNIYFEPKELGAVVKRYQHERLKNMIDGKLFLQGFMKLGFDARAREKAYILQKQRQDELNRKSDAEMKLRMSAQRVAIAVETEFSEQDLKAAMKKLAAAAALYDKASTGCPSMEAFDAAYLTPGMFREVLKRALNLVFEPKELAAIVAQYDNGRGNIDCAKFMVNFVRVGAEEREKFKVIMLEKQRRDDELRRSEHDRKMKELEKKLAIKVTYEYTDKERDSAFQKLTVAAKRYDKNHPGAMSLDGFVEKSLQPHVFREMIKRTFGVVLTEPELNACMHFFDAKKTGLLDSRKFLIYFLKLGIAQREEDHKNSLAKLRADATMREREHEEKLAAQWAKTELALTYEFTEQDKQSALLKLSDAAFKFDPASPGPMGLTAFNGKKMSPAVFKEMLRRSFNMKITMPELAALIVEFDKDGTKNIDCSEFMVRFTALGFERRSATRKSQLDRQRQMDEQARAEATEKQRAADAKMEARLAMDFESADFNAALEKIRVIAANYDRSHPSAPSLTGFTGTNMKPVEFKDMLLRTFKVTLTDKQLGALVSIFGVERDEDEFQSTRKGVDEGVRIDNAEFLKYFNKIQRDEQAKRHRERIARERELVEQEKERQRQLENKKKHDEMQRLIYTEADEVSLLDKIRHAAQEYAVDSALYMEGMQGFKGPALPSDKFRELFANIFSIKLSYPEIGVVLSILDLGGIGSLDGTRFLNWFYKICRHEEKFMLGESSDPVTFATLKAASTLAEAGPTRASTARVGTGKRSDARFRGGNGGSIARSWADSSIGYLVSDGGSLDSSQHGHSLGSAQGGNRVGSSGTGAVAVKKPGSSSAYSVQRINSKYSLSFSEGDNANDPHMQSNNAQSFTEATIKTNWVLPSITAVAVSKPNTASAGFGSMAQLVEEDEWANAEETRRHLSQVFAYSEDDPSARHKSRHAFTSSAFLNDLDAALADDTGEIYGFDGQLISSRSGGKRSLRPPSTSGADPSERRAFSKHASMSSMSALTGLSHTGSNVSIAEQSIGSRSHLKTAPAKQQRPRKVPNEVLSAIPAPTHLLLVPNEVTASIPPREGTAGSPPGGRRGRTASRPTAAARSRSPSSARPPRSSSPGPLSADTEASFGAETPATVSTKLSPKSEMMQLKQQLNPVKASAANVASQKQKREEDSAFLQAIFAPAHKSPYAQTVKIPERYPTSTTNLQKDPLIKLKLANAHFHDSPIAQMKKKRPDLFADKSVELATILTPAFIPATLPTTAPKATKRSGSPPGGKSKQQQSDAVTGKSTGKAAASASGDGGAFFFPTLLAAPVSGAPPAPGAAGPVVTFAKHANEGAKSQKEEADPKPIIANVPDIDVSGAVTQSTELDDFAFLRSILL